MRLHRRRLMLLGAGAAVASALPLPAVAIAREPMVGAALRLRESLSAAQRDRALLPFADQARRGWHYVPRRRPGLALRDMSAEQRELVSELLRTGLSAEGMRKAEGVILLEGVLADLTGARSFRDPENYSLVLFGDPDGRAPWSWRFEGHHLSLSFTVVPGVGVAATPAFFGANPAMVPDGHRHRGLRLLDDEHTLAFALIGALPESARERAILQGRSFRDILTGPGREDSLRRMEGVPLAEMERDQRDTALALVDAFVGNMEASVADRERRRIREAGLDSLHFAWAGSTTPDAPHYFRLHGPTIVIEYDNTQGGANHVHSVWHDPTNPFGDDFLRRHHERDH